MNCSYVIFCSGKGLVRGLVFGVFTGFGLGAGYGDCKTEFANPFPRYKLVKKDATLQGTTLSTQSATPLYPLKESPVVPDHTANSVLENEKKSVI